MNLNMSACAQCFTCKGYVVGICCYKKGCKLPQQLDSETLKKQVRFCHDSQNRGCWRPNCKYIHASKIEEYLFFKAGVVPIAMLDRCAVAPLYGFGNNQRVLYMGPYYHFTPHMSTHWVGGMGAPVLPRPPRAAPRHQPRAAPRRQPRPAPRRPQLPLLMSPLLPLLPRPVYYARPPINMYNLRAPVPRPASEPLHIDIPAQQIDPMHAGNGRLLCTVEQLYQRNRSFYNYDLAMAMAPPHPACFFRAYHYHSAPR